MANRIDSDEMDCYDHYELSHLDLHCLQRYLVHYTRLKSLNAFKKLCVHLHTHASVLSCMHASVCLYVFSKTCVFSKL